MKKLVALLLALSLVFGMVACASDSEPNAPESADNNTSDPDSSSSGEELEYIEGTNLLAGKPFDGTTLNLMISSPGDAQYENLKLLTEEYFTPMTGITVNWDMGAYNELYAKEVTEAMAGTTTYDLFAVNDTWGPGLRNYMLPLDDYIARDNVDLTDWADAIVEVGQMGGDGTQYGLPYRGHYMGMYYRTDIYEELGLEIPETWDELIENCKIIQEKTDLQGLSMPYGINAEQNLMPWYSFMYSLDASIFDEEWRPTFNSEAALNATEMYIGLLTEEGIVSTDNITLNEGDASMQLATGQSAHFMGWSWMVQKFINPEITDPELIDKIGIMPVPSFDGENPAVSSITMWTMGIPANAQNPDAAWEYIKWLTSADTEYKCLSDKSVYNTANCLHNSNLQMDNIVELTLGAGAYSYECFANAVHPPLFDDWMQVSDLLQIAINNCANGADVASEMNSAAEQSEQILSDLGYF